MPYKAQPPNVRELISNENTTSPGFKKRDVTSPAVADWPGGGTVKPQLLIDSLCAIFMMGGESKDSLDPDIFLQQNEICGKSAKKMSYVGNNFLRPSKLRAQ